MIKFRPHRGGLDEAMADAKEFATIKEMFEYIVEDWAIMRNSHCFEVGDLSISKDYGKDDRIDWKESRYVCTNKMWEDRYEIPQCIGICSIE